MTSEHARIITETRTPTSNSLPIIDEIAPISISLMPIPPGVILIIINNAEAVAIKFAPKKDIFTPKIVKHFNINKDAINNLAITIIKINETVFLLFRIFFKPSK